MITPSVVQFFTELLSQCKWSVYYVRDDWEDCWTMNHCEDFSFTDALTVIRNLPVMKDKMHSSSDGEFRERGPYLAFGKTQKHNDETGSYIFESPIRFTRDQILEVVDHR